MAVFRVWFSYLFIFFSLFFSTGFSATKSKVYDCFLFFNELELLKIRLHELYDQVDKFVLVESAETFRGNSKPFHFLENKHLFAEFQDKIIHVMVQERLLTDNPWDRERFQRNQIIRGLEDCEDQDIIIISDLDEILREKSISQIIGSLRRYPFIGCRLTLYWYFLNRRGKVADQWDGPIATRYKSLASKTPEDIRRLRGTLPLVRDAGWHFTWMGGYEKMVIKGASFSHIESDNANLKNPEHMRNNALFHKLEVIDETFPKYVRENEGFLREIGFIDDGKADIFINSEWSN